MLKDDTKALKNKGVQAATLLKNLANHTRLLVLCELSTGAKSVNEIVSKTNLSQPHVSAHLARFKKQKIVSCEKKGREVFYSLEKTCVSEIIQALWKEFCKK